jgi:hypothetical protein
MSIDGRWAPRPLAPTVRSAVSIALLAPCGFCWAEPGTPCIEAGQHYARYLRVYRRGVLDTAGMAAVSQAAPYTTAGTIVPDERLQAISGGTSGRSGIGNLSQSAQEAPMAGMQECP